MAENVTIVNQQQQQKEVDLLYANEDRSRCSNNESETLPSAYQLLRHHHHSSTIHKKPRNKRAKFAILTIQMC